MVTVKAKNAVSGELLHQGKLHLVDLAGSERVKKSEVSGQGMTEAQNINKSLSALGDVMAALQDKSKHVPYRNSKLTQLLADSLGGNSKTFMFVNVNPAQAAAAETLCSLNFATRVRSVERTAKKIQPERACTQCKAARAAEERAVAELSGVNARLAELERERATSQEASHRLEAELASERRQATEYRETEAQLKNSESERQQQALAEERSRVSALEAKVLALEAQLAAAEKHAAEYKAAAAEAERHVATSLFESESGAGGSGTAAEAMEALEALRQSSKRRLQGLTPSSVGRPATAPAAPLALSSESPRKPTPAPAEPAPFLAESSAVASLEALPAPAAAPRSILDSTPSPPKRTPVAARTSCGHASSKQ